MAKLAYFNYVRPLVATRYAKFGATYDVANFLRILLSTQDLTGDGWPDGWEAAHLCLSGLCECANTQLEVTHLALDTSAFYDFL